MAGAVVALASLGAGDRDLRGWSRASADGKTYLVVLDDNGGHCGPLMLDGEPWPYAIGGPGLVGPGVHQPKGGGDIGFRIPPGVTFHFDYWGP